MSAASPTPYPDLNAVLGGLVSGVQGVLGENLVGIYLQGSFAVGDFDRNSDVDFIVVTGRELSDEEVTALQILHGQLWDLKSAWAKHLEGSYFPAGILRHTSQSGKPLWYLDHGSRALIRSDHCNTVVVRWTVRACGIALAGPEPSTLIEPIPVETLRAEMRATMLDWGRDILANPERYNNRFYQAFIVLSYCRMLHDLERGRPGSKRAGAEWAKTHLDPKWVGLIDRTWAGRINPAVTVRQPADSADFAATLDFVRYCIRLSGQEA